MHCQNFQAKCLLMAPCCMAVSAIAVLLGAEADNANSGDACICGAVRVHADGHPGCTITPDLKLHLGCLSSPLVHGTSRHDSFINQESRMEALLIHTTVAMLQRAAAGVAALWACG